MIWLPQHVWQVSLSWKSYIHQINISALCAPVIDQLRKACLINPSSFCAALSVKAVIIWLSALLSDLPLSILLNRLWSIKVWMSDQPLIILRSFVSQSIKCLIIPSSFCAPLAVNPVIVWSAPHYSAQLCQSRQSLSDQPLIILRCNTWSVNM